MGAWGAGNFENDDALDLVGELAAAAGLDPLADLFDAVIAAGMQGEEIAASKSCRVMAAADLLAALRGHAASDLPDDAAALLETAGKPAPELVEKACSAVSYVLMSSELVELWAESDDPAEWNQVASDLIARLDAPARAARIPKRKRNELTGAICAFCGERIPMMELVLMAIRRPWSPEGITREIFAHESCLNSKLHSSRIVQWWTAPGPLAISAPAESFFRRTCQTSSHRE